MKIKKKLENIFQLSIIYVLEQIFKKLQFNCQFFSYCGLIFGIDAQLTYIEAVNILLFIIV